MKKKTQFKMKSNKIKRLTVDELVLNYTISY